MKYNRVKLYSIVRPKHVIRSRRIYIYTFTSFANITRLHVFKHILRYKLYGHDKTMYIIKYRKDVVLRK